MIMESPNTPAKKNGIRRPKPNAKYEPSRSTKVEIHPNDAPNQYVPLMISDTVPLIRAGVSSPMHEFIAAYSPPMPMPITAKQTA
jgi:hypothetical protein